MRTIQAVPAATGDGEPVAARAAVVITASLLKKPLVGGRPASAAKPIVMVQNVIGRPTRSPPMSDMRLLPTALITAPAQRNSSALNAAWDSRGPIAGTRPPTASPAY